VAELLSDVDRPFDSAQDRRDLDKPIT
jgi:hypothetical protein